MPDEVLTAEQVADELRVNIRRVYKWLVNFCEPEKVQLKNVTVQVFFSVAPLVAGGR